MDRYLLERLADDRIAAVREAAVLARQGRPRNGKAWKRLQAVLARRLADQATAHASCPP